MRRTAALLVAGLTALGGCSPGGPGEPVEDAGLEQTARDFVALLGGYNCELLPGYLASGADEFFRANIIPALMDTMTDPIERVCFVLGVIQKYPRSETMEVRAEALTDARADLILVGNEREAELRFVGEGGGWKLNHEWALAQVQDLPVQQALRLFAITQDEFFYSHGERFSVNPQEITAATHTVAEFGQGIATTEAAPMVVYAVLGPDAQSVCGSSLSLSGELFMIRAAADGSASYARGTLPASCPGRPLADSW